MTVAQLLRETGVTRILLVDDDLDMTVTLKGLQEHAVGVNIEEMLSDDDHDITEKLIEELERHGLPSNTVSDRVAGLRVDAVRNAADELLQKTYAAVLEQREGFNKPLVQIKSWVTGKGIALDEWSAPKVEEFPERYDLLIIDFYLEQDSFEATIKLINKVKAMHQEQENPLLVILMSSNVAGLQAEFEHIRNQCRMSASRYRILAKPVQTNLDSDVKAKWERALTQLARERKIVKPIEEFIDSWKRTLNQACEKVVERLYDLDASAFAMLSATADKDSMKIEEYTADILSRRISAETEEAGFPFEDIIKLQRALAETPEVGPMLDQGVEVRSAQHGIRSLMCDIIWHREPWWLPKSDAPAYPQAIGEDEQGQVDREAHNHKPQAILTERLVWMKRYLRFGTLVKRRSDGQIFVNLTQACDIQSVRLSETEDVHYLFMRGNQLSVDAVGSGEKVVDSSYYCTTVDSDEFYTVQWNLRRPYTPSMSEVFEHLEDYQLIGQLRNESAYGVLTKYTSQASRVAHIRMPKVYRYSAKIYKKSAQNNYARLDTLEMEASVWQRDDKYWKVQLSVEFAQSMLQYFKGLTVDQKDTVAGGLATGVKVESAKDWLPCKVILPGKVILARLEAKTVVNEQDVIALMQKSEALKGLDDGFFVVFCCP